MVTIADLPEEILEKVLFLLDISDLFRIKTAKNELPPIWNNLAKNRLDHIRRALVDSDGVAAYYEGAALGEFQLCEREGFYRQNGGPYKLVKVNGMWEVEHNEGFAPFINIMRSSAPPRNGWRFRKGPSTLSDPDLSIRLSSNSLLRCSSVLLSSSQCSSKYVGLFCRSEPFRMGRPVFQNDHGQVLWVGHSSWIVTDREVMWQKGKVKRNMVMVNSGGIAHVCPGNKKAKWWYLDKSKRREDETMEVTCQHFEFIEEHTADIGKRYKSA